MKITILSAFILTGLLSYSFKPETSDWSEWKVSQCYSKIQFRIKKSGYQPKDKDSYDIEVKNNYSENVSLGFALLEVSDPMAKEHQRRNLDSNGGSTSFNSRLIGKGKSPWVHI